jgi:hypothetical protein
MRDSNSKREMIMKKVFLTIFCFAVCMSCEDLTDLNNNPKRTDKVPAGALFASAQKSLVDQLTTPNVNQNIFRLIAQHWTETTYTDEANYDLGTRAIPDNWWHAFYRDVLQDLREAKEIVMATEPDGAARQNKLATAEILEVYTWAILVDTFGDIPYENALSVSSSPDDVLTPEYDEGATIYPDLISRISAAISDLDVSAGSWDGSDLIYGGDVAHWIKFGNAIKLRLGMMIADVNNSLAKTTVEQAAAATFTSNADNAVLYYKAAPPNTNPVWVNLVQSGRKDFVAANTLVDEMESLSDPRIPFYFTKDAGNGYSGGIYGASNNYIAYSKPADLVDNADFPASLFDYQEVEFFLAEAVERGYAVGGTAAQHYNAAITASMQSWGVDPADITAYLARPDVAYATAPGTYREKIGIQKWIALYNRGFEAWTEWRRLDSPTLVAPPDAFSDVPLRFTYPVSEQNLNTINYDAAVAKIGADDVSTTVFWDVM